MYTVNIEIRNHGSNTIKLFSRRGIEEQADTYDVYMASYVSIEVRYKGRIIDRYERGVKKIRH